MDWWDGSELKAPVTKLEDLSSNPRTHRLDGEEQILQVVLWPLWVRQGVCIPTHLHTYTHKMNTSKYNILKGEWLKSRGRRVKARLCKRNTHPPNVIIVIIGLWLPCSICEAWIPPHPTSLKNPNRNTALGSQDKGRSPSVKPLQVSRRTKWWKQRVVSEDLIETTQPVALVRYVT